MNVMSSRSERNSFVLQSYMKVKNTHPNSGRILSRVSPAMNDLYRVEAFKFLSKIEVLGNKAPSSVNKVIKEEYPEDSSDPEYGGEDTQVTYMWTGTLGEDAYTIEIHVIPSTGYSSIYVLRGSYNDAESRQAILERFDIEDFEDWNEMEAQAVNDAIVNDIEAGGYRGQRGSDLSDEEKEQNRTAVYASSRLENLLKQNKSMFGLD